MRNAQRFIHIVCETPQWMAVEKPSGLFTHPSELDRQADDLLSILEQQTSLKLAPLTRLDRGTSGLIIFTKNSHAAKSLQKQWQHESTIKSYLCLARGDCAESFISDRPLTDHKTKTLKAAKTSFQKCENYPRCTLLKATIESGRTHQIRRHLAHLGQHILGDTTYGKGAINRWARDLGLNRLFLHCHELSFIDPFTQQTVKITSALPKELQNVLEKIKLSAEAIY